MADLRLHIEGDDGKRSNEWTIKIGGSKKADVYVAPRSMFGQIKVSLHESGQCRIGPTRNLRERISWRFRQAHHVWHHDRGSSIAIPTLALVFRHEQLLTVAEAPHPESVALPLSTGDELWVVLTLLSPQANLTANFEGLESLCQMPLGDGNVLDLHVLRRSENPAWLEEVYSFDPDAATEYPASLSGTSFGYAIAGTEHRPFPIILEISGETVEAQRLEAPVEEAHRRTSEEYVLDRLTAATTKLEEIVGGLRGRGPVWDGQRLSDAAAAMAQAMKAIVEALATVDRISHIDGGQLLGPELEDPELRGLVEVVRRIAGSPCRDPDCPDHYIGEPD